MQSSNILDKIPVLEIIWVFYFMDEKYCKYCNKKLERREKENRNNYEARQYCNMGCKNDSQKGKSNVNSGSFKKNSIPWNKGIEGNYFSKQVVDKAKERIKAYIANETPEQREKRTFKFRTMPRVATMKGKVETLSPNWKGESATYNAKHRWIQTHWKKTGICELCLQKRKPKPNTRLKWGTHWANKSGEYLRQREDWYELCPKCHKKFDNR